MRVFQQLQQQTRALQHKLVDHLDRLSHRERILVIATSIFLVFTLIGVSLWSMHQAAEKQQMRLNTLNHLIVWMQDRVVEIPPTSDVSVGLTEKIQRAAQTQALSVSLQENNGAAQILVNHAQYAVLANFLTQLVQSGLSIEKMVLISENGQIKLTAMVHE
ncbi:MULTISPECIES: type II secretion system protein GspM [unclassified Acinetobacter]|uniref:type II secretion system protein GspM n=1 Tax=unclassified Acinetobacter TaxID=196816 RepID=UPI002935100E|nr:MULTISPECIES: type II secretion system protein GspM [unclassified Acinetobacter]WOE31714.1 type II secretion system protein GspM [Acinetobacter sp. SAAs470]WOE37181.1 type II secretion system protein GspM [Acinetobacter sp. SAAs474]